MYPGRENGNPFTPTNVSRKAAGAWSRMSAESGSSAHSGHSRSRVAKSAAIAANRPSLGALSFRYRSGQRSAARSYFGDPPRNTGGRAGGRPRAAVE